MKIQEPHKLHTIKTPAQRNNPFDAKKRNEKLQEVTAGGFEMTA